MDILFTILMLVGFSLFTMIKSVNKNNHKQTGERKAMSNELNQYKKD